MAQVSRAHEQPAQGQGHHCIFIAAKGTEVPFLHQEFRNDSAEGRKPPEKLGINSCSCLCMRGGFWCVRCTRQEELCAQPSLGAASPSVNLPVELQSCCDKCVSH